MNRRTPLSSPQSDPRACSAGARVNALARVPFLAHLDHDALHRVDGRTTMRGMDAEEAIHLAGAPADRLYVIATGAVKLTGVAPDGTEVLLDVLGPGSFLGSLPTIGGTTFAEHAWALTPGCLLSFTETAFDAVLDDHPSVARQALAAVVDRVRAAQQRIQRTAATTAPVRIASTLLVLADRLGVADGERTLIDVPLSRDDLASLAGCAPETVSRSLATWSREGIVDSGRRWVAVRDLQRLSALAHTAPLAGAPRS